MTLYLKYRPQKISDLDSAVTRDALTGVLGTDNVPHAFLFSGPRGVGKTSSARILAKAVNCQNRNGVEPCGMCEMCVEIMNGLAMDVIEIDAASNRGIDEIREIRERASLAPMKATMKVFIIDEVHMLTAEAANALLKTLEEPPAQVMFVLCTTDPERLPETVISRCMRIQVGKPSVREIVTKLKSVGELEKIKFDDMALERIAKASRGSFRDAIKFLEQVFLSKKKVDLLSTEEVLGVMVSAAPEQMVNAIMNRDASSGLALIAALVDAGGDVKGFVEQIAEIMREYFLENAQERTNILPNILAIEKVYEQMRFATIASLPLEVFVAGLGGDDNRIEKVAKVKKIVEVEPERVIVGPEVVEESQAKYSLDDLKGKWGDVMKAVRPRNHSVEALLRSTAPLSFDGRFLTVEVFYQFHKDKLESDRCRSIVEEVASDILSTKQVKLKLVLGSGKKSVESDEDLVRAAENIFKA